MIHSNYQDEKWSNLGTEVYAGGCDTEKVCDCYSLDVANVIVAEHNYVLKVRIEANKGE